MFKYLTFELLMLLVVASVGFASGQNEVSVDSFPFFPATPRNPEAIELEAPIKSWDEAIPLGNGMTGILMWGEGSELKLSVDRADLWDNREVLDTKKDTYAKIIEWQGQGKHKKIYEIFDKPYDTIAYPTKLPGGRLVVNLGRGNKLDEFSLSFKTGVGQATFKNKQTRELELFFAQKDPVAFLRFPSELGITLDNLYWVLPGESRSGTTSNGTGVFADLGYPATREEVKNGIKFFIQETTTEFTYMLGAKFIDDETLAIFILTTPSGEDLFAEAQTFLAGVVAKGVESHKSESLAWWENYNAESSVQIADEGIAHQYYFTKYLLGAGGRKGAPPIPLQGVWTADTNGLPPWKGDFHWDLNMQMNYWPVFMSGATEQADAYTKFLMDLMPKFQAFSRDFYGVVGGIAIPGVMTLGGGAMGGWLQYSLSPANTIWAAHHLYWQWKYENDFEFLSEQAYPFLKGIGILFEGLLKPNAKGQLKLPLSTSPEIYDNSPRAWLPTNSNYDQSLMLWLYDVLAELAIELDNNEEARWEKLHNGLDPLAIDSDNLLMFAPGRQFNESHRHHSAFMSIYPLQTMDAFGPDKTVVDATLSRMDQIGTQRWVGYSHSWAACMHAIAENADRADWYLSILGYAYVSRNGFHVNGDQKNTGTCSSDYRPFTLEGNFGAMQAVHLMMLQNRGDVIHLFPSIPERWGECGFTDLRVYGNAKISASWENRLVSSMKVIAPAKQGVVLKFDTKRLPVEWIAANGMIDANGLWTISLGAGETAEF